MTKKKQKPAITSVEPLIQDGEVNGTVAVEAQPVEVQPATSALAGREEVESNWTDDDARFWTWAMVFLIVGIGLRQYDLAAFPFHPDEAIHAWFPLSFLTYTYDPVYHGPLLYHLQAFVYALFGGPNDFTARLVPSLLGIGLLAVVIGPARRWLGSRGALWALGLLAISPVIVTYQRRLLHDSLVMLLTLGAVLCFQAARENAGDTATGRNARIGLAMVLALFMATKANVFFIIAMLAAFWLMLRVRPWVRSRWPEAKMRNAADWLLPVALFVLTLFSILQIGQLRRQLPVAPWVWALPVTLLLLAGLCYWLLSGRRRGHADFWKWLPLGMLGVVAAASILALREPRVPPEWSKIIESAFSFTCVLAVLAVWLWLLLAPNRQNTSDESTPVVDFSTPRRRDLRTPALAGWAALLVFAFFYGRGFLWYQIPIRMASKPSVWATEVQKSVGQIATTAVAPLTHLARGEVQDVWKATRNIVAQETTPWSLAGAGVQKWEQVPDWQVVTTAIPRMLHYWGKQQQQPRLPGPHDYYIVLMLLYELPIAIAGLGGLMYASRHRTPFTDLLVWWAITSFALYALANEKVPWLLTHIMLPWALLGGYWLAQLRPARVLRPVLITACVVGAVYLLRGTIANNFERAVERREPMFYAQTSEQYRDALFQASRRTEGQPGTVWIHQDKQWPTVWYIRAGSPLLGNSPMVFSKEPPAGDLRFVLADPGQWNAQQRFRSWTGKTVDIYAWPRASWPALRPDVWARFWWTRQASVQNGVLAPPGEWPPPAVVVIGTPP